MGPAVCCTGLASRPCPGRTPSAHPPRGRLRSWLQTAAFLSSHPSDSVLLPAQPGCESWGHQLGGAQEEECVSWKRREQQQGRQALQARQSLCEPAGCRCWLNVAFAHPKQLIEVPSFWGMYSGGCEAATELAGIFRCKGMESLVLRTQALLATYT